MIALIRTVFLWLHVALFALHSLAGRAFIRDRASRVRFHARTCHFHAAIAVRYLGFRVTVLGREHIPSDHRVLLVANHTGYVDVVVLSSILSTLYITSTELQKTFFLGFMATIGGSLFVNRRSKSRLLQEIDEIRKTVEHGSPVVLFPEGTSSDGLRVLPFKSALFKVAEHGEFAVAPVCIRYRLTRGKPVTADNCARICYFGGARFLPHVLGLPFATPLDIDVEFLPHIPHDSGRSRKEVAEQCREAIIAAHGRMGGDDGDGVGC